MEKIKDAYNQLVEAIKAEGLEPRIQIWIHSHIQNEDYSQQKMMDLFARRSGERVDVDIDTALFKREYLNKLLVKLHTGGEFVAIVPKPENETDKHPWLMVD